MLKLTNSGNFKYKVWLKNYICYKIMDRDSICIRVDLRFTTSSHSKERVCPQTSSGLHFGKEMQLLFLEAAELSTHNNNLAWKWTQPTCAESRAHCSCSSYCWRHSLTFCSNLECCRIPPEISLNHLYIWHCIDLSHRLGSCNSFLQWILSPTSVWITQSRTEFECLLVHFLRGVTDFTQMIWWNVSRGMSGLFKRDTLRHN